MTKMIGYKLLRASGRSLSKRYGAVFYPLDGTPIDVPHRGAFVGGSIEGLVRGGCGPLLAECEYDAVDRLAGDGDVAEVRRLRVVRSAVVDRWTWTRVAIRIARDLSRPGPSPRVLAALEAAERYERERTPEAASSAAAAAWAATVWERAEWEAAASAAAWEWPGRTAWGASASAAAAASSAESAEWAAAAASAWERAAWGATRRSAVAYLVAEAWPVAAPAALCADME